MSSRSSTRCRATQPDLVFNLAESFGGKSALESNVAALLNLLDLRYTGSSPAGLLVAGRQESDEEDSCAFTAFRRRSSRPCIAARSTGRAISPFPVIVKPPQEDASLGITSASVVHEIKDLFARIGELQTEYQQPVLVEQFIEGREFYVGVLGNVERGGAAGDRAGFHRDSRPTVRASRAGRRSGARTAKAAAPSSRARSRSFPTGLDAELATRMQKVAVEAFHALRLRDYGRIDLRVSTTGEIYVIEVNPNCYLERESEFARAAKKGGLEYRGPDRARISGAGERERYYAA